MTDDGEPEVTVVHPPGGSLYAMIFGDGSRGHPLLAHLGFGSLGELGRYRDAWIEQSPDGDPWIAVYTRLGGANREDYAEVIRGLRTNPHYLLDRDGTFDDTYATFYFRPPEDLVATLDELAEGWRDEVSPTVDMDRLWQEAIDLMGGDNDGS